MAGSTQKNQGWEESIPIPQKSEFCCLFPSWRRRAAAAEGTGAPFISLRLSLQTPGDGTGQGPGLAAVCRLGGKPRMTQHSQTHAQAQPCPDPAGAHRKALLHCRPCKVLTSSKDTLCPRPPGSIADTSHCSGKRDLFAI